MDDYYTMTRQIAQCFQFSDYLLGRSSRTEDRFLTITEEMLEMQKKIDETSIQIDQMHVGFWVLS